MIKAIIFDCGGVILSNDWNVDGKDPQFDIITERLGISKELVLKVFRERYPEVTIGKKAEDYFFNALLEVAKNKVSLGELKKLYYSCIQKKPAFELVERLYQKYPLYTLNDEPRKWMDLRIEKFNLRKYFKDFITSGYFGCAKPDKRIYEILLERSGFKAEECLFIDNRENLLVPAKAL